MTWFQCLWLDDFSLFYPSVGRIRPQLFLPLRFTQIEQNGFNNRNNFEIGLIEHVVLSTTVTFIAAKLNAILFEKRYFKILNFFPGVSGKIFSWKLAYVVPRGIQKTSSTEKYVISPLPRPELRLSTKSLYYFTNRVIKLMQPCVCRNLISL